MRRILVIRLRRLGDVLTSTPFIRGLRRRFPDARIDALVTSGFEEPLEGNPHLDSVHSLRHGLPAWLNWWRHCRGARYDLVVDLQGNPRSVFALLATCARSRVGWEKGRLRDWAYTSRASYAGREHAAAKKLRLLGLLGHDDTDTAPELAVSPADHGFIRRYLARTGLAAAKPLVALSVVARVSRKRWAPDKYARLADRLVREQGARVVLTHGPGETPQVMEVVARMRTPGAVVAERMPLARLAALYRRCDVWIGNDGGPKHVAVAAGCPAVMLIGSHCAPRPAGCAQEWVTPPVADAGVDGVRERDAYRAASRLLAARMSDASSARSASDQV